MSKYLEAKEVLPSRRVNQQNISGLWLCQVVKGSHMFIELAVLLLPSLHCYQYKLN